MAEQLEQISSATLHDVGKDNAQISFVITNASQVIRESDGDGSLIVYAEHLGNPATYNDAFSSYYSDLYIGDEHIAGGFGFRNTTERNYAYSAVFDTLPELQNIVNDLSINGGSSSTTETSKLSIDPDYSYVTTDNGIYELQYDSVTTTLKLYCDHKDAISSTIVRIDEKEIIDGSSLYPIDINETTFGLKNLDATFSYSINDYIDKIYFTYTIVNKNDIQTSDYIEKYLYGTASKPYELGKIDDGYLKSEQLYAFENPNIKPKVIEAKWRISFESNFIALIMGIHTNNKFSKMAKIYLNAISGSKKLSAPICTLNFVEPIYYCAYSNVPISFDQFNKKVCNEDDRTLVFGSQSSTSTYNYVLVSNNYNKDNVKFMHIGSNLYVDWENAKFSFAQKYNGFVSPNKYNGTIKWKILIANQ